jgi:hypothetical protein
MDGYCGACADTTVDIDSKKQKATSFFKLIDDMVIYLVNKYTIKVIRMGFVCRLLQRGAKQRREPL